MVAPQFISDMHGKLNTLQKAHRSGKLRPYAYRMSQLEALKRFLVEKDHELNEALWKDLRKSVFESAVTEQGVVVGEIEYALEHLSSWMKTERVATPLINQPGHCEIRREPFGVTLIIGAWNYPINLLLAPLVGAIAGGNATVLKPSEIAAETSRVIAEYLPQYLDPDCVAVLAGGVDETTEILAQPFDFIFFTGSTKVGKIVMGKAAEHLTPVVLELGGKSPTLVLDEASLETAAKRITWGKFMNAGQTCVAPDYILVLPHLEEQLIAELKKAIVEFYGEDPRQSADYCRIVNDRNYERLKAFLSDGELAHGGRTSDQERYIEPTILRSVPDAAAVMQEEIFGPILPILKVKDADEAIAFINQRPKPLALYAFTGDKKLADKVIDSTSAGGVCINDVVMHMPVPELPFGGVGNSGMGSYHGRRSFECFTHAKGILSKTMWPDFALRYPPYAESRMKWLKLLR